MSSSHIHIYIFDYISCLVNITPYPYTYKHIFLNTSTCRHLATQQPAVAAGITFTVAPLHQRHRLLHLYPPNLHFNLIPRFCLFSSRSFLCALSQFHLGKSASPKINKCLQERRQQLKKRSYSDIMSWMTATSAVASVVRRHCLALESAKNRLKNTPNHSHCIHMQENGYKWFVS